MGKAKLFLFVILATVVAASLGFAAETGFRAKLKGYYLAPGVRTSSKGMAEFKLSTDGKELRYKLTVKNIENVTGAHIHMGKKRKNGPPLAGLFAGPKKEGKFTGILAEGTITEKDLMGDLQGKSLDALVKLIKSGNTYVNVQTDAFPDGEIRGQIR